VEGNGRRIALGRDGRLPARARPTLSEGIRASGVTWRRSDVRDPAMLIRRTRTGLRQARLRSRAATTAEYNGLKMVLAGTTLGRRGRPATAPRIESAARRARRHRRVEIREAYLNRITSDVRLRVP